MAASPEPIPVSLPLSRGLDTKTDPKTVAAPFLTRLENAVFVGADTLTKRNGYGLLPLTVIGSSNLAAGFGTATYDDELILFDDVSIYSYGIAVGAWARKGNTIAATTASLNVVRNAYDHTQADWAVSGNLAVHVYVDTRGGVRCSTVDRQTGVSYAADVLIDATGTRPRAIAVGSGVLIGFYSAVGTIKMVRVTAASPTTFAAATTAFSDVNTNQVWDWVLFGASVLVAYAEQVNQAIKLSFVTEFGIAGNPGLGFPNPVTLAANPIIQLCLVPMGGNMAVFGIESVTPQMALYVVTPSLVTTITTLDTTFIYNGIGGMTGYFANNELVLFYGTTSGLPTLCRSTYNVAGTRTSNSVYGYDVSLAAKSFLYKGAGYIVLSGVSPQQSSYMVVKAATGQVVTRHLYGTAGGPVTANQLPQTLAPVTGVYAWPGLRRGAVQSQNGTIFTLRGVSLLTADFTNTARYATAVLNRQLHMVGGVPQSYDGSTVTEHGFLQYPETIINSSNPTTGGALTNGTRLYYVLYEWTDNKGQLHRSQVSSPFTVTLAGGTSTQVTNLALPPLRLTAKTGVIISVFRTTASGQVAFKASSTTSPLISDPTQITQAFSDTLSDAAIINNETLYTTGGVLGNDPPPPCSLIATGKKRIFLAGGEDPDLVYYSKTTRTGEGVAFSLAFTKRINPRGGPITALGILDDKVVVFKTNSLYIFTGDGPNDTGGGNTFDEAQIVASDVGCINPASIVVGAEGLYFASNKGIYLMTRAVEILYVGAPVEAFNSQTITSAVLMPKTNQLRFGCAAGLTLVYNYYFKGGFGEQGMPVGQWSTFTNYTSQGATVWQDKYAFLRSTGQVCVEDTGYSDGGQAVTMLVELSWVKPFLLGFQRVFELGVLGNFYSDHVLEMSLGYDMQPYYSQRVSFDTRIGIPLDTWGTASAWGADGTWGSYGDSSYQLRSRIPVQQCSAFRVLIREVMPSPITPGQGLSLNAVTLLAARQPGMAKLPGNRTI